MKNKKTWFGYNENLEIKLLSNNAILPKRANDFDSGLDLYVSETTTIKAGETKAVKTDVAINLPHGYEAQVRPRSGNSLKTKLRIALGTIDHTYNKEIGIITDNIGDEAIIVKAGTRLAQLVVTPVMLPEPTEVQEFDEVSERGAYGSTGE
ncbi:dUTP diphosphatase [Staphylococcus haemolyticus]|uniref:dUTP diphosphatase n=1 Tax=Staphylococcus haemolyticus TaxID=1283 RepID=UPI001F0B1F1E|nr:dUTP diphosphatase [Staphylococcus haemolyticus]